MNAADLYDQNPLAALHGDLEIACGRTLSVAQVNNLWQRWSKTKRLPAWLARLPRLATQVTERLGA
jgi:hypothetical protein